MFRHLRVHQVFGANTEVGKTLFATALCRASVAAGEASHYLKPVGTGGLGDDSHISTFSPKTQVTCLYRFDEPVSPHLAAQRARVKDGSYSPPSDNQFVQSLAKHLENTVKSTAGNGRRASLIVETAGGVHSPTLSGTSQAEAYRPLRLPTVLIASPHLGGISTTLSSYESLLLRGYTIDALLCLEEAYYENWRYFSQWAQDKGLAFASMKQPPAQQEVRKEDIEQMQSYYRSVVEDAQGASTLPSIIGELQRKHEERLQNLQLAPSQARSSHWYPFVQHNHIKQDSDIMVIDSAYKDSFTVHSETSGSGSNLSQVFDGSASWWTQCFGHAHPEITLAAAHAAGRYGHVIFPMATHEPALNLTKALLMTVGDGWADRVFFSDDGSTGMEVALKMALKTSALKIKTDSAKEPLELSVLGMKGSYHGDTIGVMDASEPSVYNKSVDWYRGRGFWLDVPTINIQQGKIVLQVPTEEWESAPPQTDFANMSEVYDVEGRIQRQDPLYGYYYEIIDRLVYTAQREHNLTFGTLVIEPLVVGAGGMLFVDPLFQRALVDYARKGMDTVLPVVYDEVFVGLYRLGIQTSSHILGAKPDIACYAKILTGGLVPMSVTLASKEIFGSYLGEKKQDALLHGHSYTAQPVGCAVANKSLEMLQKIDASGEDWNAAKAAWSGEQTMSADPPKSKFLSLWGQDFIHTVSCLPNVESVMTMGTVLKISLLDLENAGYQSTASADFLARLRHPSDGSIQVHARPLGNTVYWMSSINTSRATLSQVESAILKALF